jgi:hypothetical protein
MARPIILGRVQSSIDFALDWLATVGIERMEFKEATGGRHWVTGLNRLDAGQRSFTASGQPVSPQRLYSLWWLYK